MDKILLFGGSGFIGSNLTEKFKKEEVDLLVPLHKECNLANVDEVATYIKKNKPDVIINAAFKGVSANIPFSQEYITVNSQMITNILMACRGERNVKKIVHFGSAAEYGDSKKPISEDSPVAPKKIYGTAKAISTLSALEVAREYSLPLVILRAFYLFGPFDNKSVLYYLLSSINKKEIHLTKGEQMRDYMYIKDFTSIVFKICQSPNIVQNGEIYNIGRGEGIKLNEMFRKIFNLYSREPEYKIIPYSKNEYFSQIANNKKIVDAVKIKKFTSIDEGLNETIDWFKASN